MLTSNHDGTRVWDDPGTWESPRNASRNAQVRARVRRSQTTRRRQAIAAATAAEALPPVITGHEGGIAYVEADEADWQAFFAGDPLEREAIADELAEERMLAQELEDLAAEALAPRTQDIYGSTFDPDECQWGFSISTRPAGANCR